MTCATYILLSEKLNKFYVGATSDLDKRIIQHNSGRQKFTSLGIPWKVVYYETFETLQAAKKREIQIKKMKSKKFTEQLIRNRDGRASRS